MKHLSLVKMFSLQKRLLAFGGRVVSDATVIADLSLDCEDPQTVEYIARDSYGVTFSNKGGFVRPSPRVQDKFLRAIIETRCRKCARCKLRRKRMWSMRAQSEFRAAARTWMGTLTFPFSEHLELDYRLTHALAKQGLDFEALSQSEKFFMAVSGYRSKLPGGVPGLGAEVTKWLKRVRKNSGAPLRYLFVIEAHEGDGENHGRPHFHCLLHETSALLPVRKKTLQEAWPHFTNFKLVTDERGPAYVCKYLVKAEDVRVRPSLHYGSQEPETSSDIEVKRVF